MQGDALIQANFHINPKHIQMSEWREMYAKAMWLEEWRLKNQAELYMNLFGGQQQ